MSLSCLPRPGLQEGIGRVQRWSGPRERAQLWLPEQLDGLGDPRQGSPAATALERPLLRLWPSGPVISDLGAPGLGPGSGAWGEFGSPRTIFSRRSEREGTIYRSNGPRSLRQWNPACVTRADIPGPPSRSAPSGSPARTASRRNRTAPRALVWPGLAGRASEAPPPLPVRHGELKRRVGDTGEPQWLRLRKSS